MPGTMFNNQMDLPGKNSALFSPMGCHIKLEGCGSLSFALTAERRPSSCLGKDLTSSDGRVFPTSDRALAIVKNIEMTFGKCRIHSLLRQKIKWKRCSNMVWQHWLLSSLLWVPGRSILSIHSGFNWAAKWADFPLPIC